MNKAIEIHNISKKYLLHHEGTHPNTTLVETLARNCKKICKSLRNPFSRKEPSQGQEDSYKEFWALQYVSFDIEQGDRVGIIGRNGAGKSTLLKILSRITEPSAGSVKIRGRLSSLLEVGTGFHPELTGRENIFLNGAILGMTQNEIKKKFDEIVHFSEVEQFLDTPIKRFSSGMYMRLGFAIAAHVNADVLIIDEVLAVGDAQFQDKCFRKLHELGSKGSTVIFVSHDIGSVLSLCNRGIYLENGRVKESGSIDSCVNAYMKSYRELSFQWQGNIGDEHIRFYNVSLEGKNEFFYQNENPLLHIDYEIFTPNQDLFLCIGIWNMRNQLLARSQTFDDPNNYPRFVSPGRHRLAFKLDAGLFHEGEYLIKLHCAIQNKKKISDNEIVLRFPVYSQKNSRFGHTLEREGIFLGNRWEWHPPT